MDGREKLVELLRNSPHLDVVKGYKNNDCTFKQGADWLIANGVTVQEWIPVKDRLPENSDDVLLCRKWWNEIRNPQIGWYNEVSRSWFDLSNRKIHNVTHWMHFPQPPKEE